jgi:hypothetical protein
MDEISEAAKNGMVDRSPRASTSSGYLKWVVGGAAVIITFAAAFAMGSASGWNAGKQFAIDLYDVAGLEHAACPTPGTVWSPAFHRCVEDADVKARCPTGTGWDNAVGKCSLRIDPATGL